MNFLNPLFLLGLLAVAIPVVIHLINLRKPKKVLFSTLTFFNALKKSTIRRIRIKQYVLMALRIAVVLFLALALARPFLPPSMSGTARSNDPKAIVIVIDNSPSMGRIGTKGPLIEQAKEIAAAIADGARPGDRFMVETTNGSFDTASLTGVLSAKERIGEIEVSNTGNFTSEALKLLYEQLKQVPMKQAVIYIITDGQKSQFAGFEQITMDRRQGSKPISLQMVTVEGASLQNIAVSSLTLESRMLSKDSPFTIQVEVKNTGGAVAANQFISLEVENRMTGQYQVTLDPGQSQEFLFEVIPHNEGDISGRVLLEGDEITYDNSRYFAVHIPESRSVLFVNGQKAENSGFVSYLKPALEASELSNTQIQVAEKQVAGVDQSNWQDHDVIVLDGLREIPEYWFQDLQRYVQNGKGILFFPSERGNIRNYNRFMDLFNAGSFNGIKGEYASFKSVGRLGNLTEGHPVLNELFEKNADEQIRVDLPELFFFYRYQESGNTGSYPILRSETGLPLLTEQHFGEGRVLISAIGTDPGWSNFPVSPLFAPLYHRSVLYAASSEQGGIEEHVLGTPFVWEGSLNNYPVELKKADNIAKPEVQDLPEGIRIRYDGREWEPGILEIEAGNEKRLIAVNQHIMESHFATLENKELENLIGNSLTVHSIIDANNLSEENLRQRLYTAGFGEEIWNWFIWIALVFLIAETLVSKLYKAESIS